mgnify:CR=1 FL=1
MTNIFEYRDYKEILNTILANPDAPRGYQGKLAIVAKCQKSFMSQVVKGEVQLNLDQAARLTRHFKWSEEETDYFLTLVEYARAGSKELRQILDRRISTMQTSRFRPRKTYEDTYIIPEADRAAFYNNWYVSGVYMMIGVESRPQEMARRLRISEQRVADSLQTLKDIGLVEERRGKLQKTKTSLWLNDSPFISNFRNAWRNYGQLHMPMAGDDEIFYSSLFTVSEQTLLEYYREISKCIAALKEKSVDKMPETELCCVNIDFFKI